VRRSTAAALAERRSSARHREGIAEGAVSALFAEAAPEVSAESFEQQS